MKELTGTKAAANAFFIGCAAAKDMERQETTLRLGIPFRSACAYNKEALKAVHEEVVAAYEEHRLARNDKLEELAAKDDQGKPIVKESNDKVTLFEYGDRAGAEITEALAALPELAQLHALLMEEVTMKIKTIPADEFPEDLERLFDNFSVMLTH